MATGREFRSTRWRRGSGSGRHGRLWRGSWSPKRSPTAGSTACGPPATRSTSASGCPPAELLEAVVGRPRPDHPLGDARSTDEVLAAGTDLLVVGRAGIGLDNVDVEAATRRGVMVVNAPQSNIVSAAEHTMALLLAQARNVPQAHAALVAGRWERSKWEGVELADKTLGIVGLGRIGKLVADRARGFGMRLDRLRPVRLGRARPPARRRAAAARPGRRRVRLPHHPPAEDGRDEGAHRARPAAQGQADAARSSTSPAAASSTRRRWPTPSARASSPAPRSTCSTPSRRRRRRCSSSTSVVVTPHLGASTREAQDKAGDTIADMVQLALAGEFVPFAVNLAAAEAHDDLRPFLPLAERLGRAVRVAGRASCRRRSRSPSRATSAATTPASSGCRC